VLTHFWRFIERFDDVGKTAANRVHWETMLNSVSIGRDARDAANPDVTSVQVGTFDLNGQLRGKRMPVKNLQAALDGRIRMPVSLAAMDISGCYIKDSPLVFESGDSDTA
jgi:hypothetical protein